MVRVVVELRRLGVHLRDGLSPWIFSIAGGKTVGQEHKLLQRVLQHMCRIVPAVVLTRGSRDGHAPQVRAVLENTRGNGRDTLRKDERLQDAAAPEQELAHMVVGRGVPPFDAVILTHVQVVGLAVLVLLDVGIIEVQVAKLAIGGSAAATLVAVVAGHVAEHPEVEVVDRTAHR